MLKKIIQSALFEGEGSANLLETNLSPVDETKNIQTLTYYKNRKAGNLFLRNNIYKKNTLHAIRKGVNPTNHILDTQLLLSNSITDKPRSEWWHKKSRYQQSAVQISLDSNEITQLSVKMKFI